MDFRPSHRTQTVKPSLTLSVSAKAAAMQTAGKEVLDLSAEEPDFDTPAHIKAAAIEALQAGFTKYTAVDGTAELKQAVIDKFWRENALRFDLDQILVSAGSRHSLYNLMQAVLDPDDEVIIPAPYWTAYPDMARLAGANPVIIKTTIEHHFKISPEQLRGALSEKSRLVIINSPSNPAGICYSVSELKALGAVLVEHPEVIVATDDVYEHIRWNESPFRNILNLCPLLHNRAVVLNGVSKAYAMTGWRIGYAAGPKKIIQAMYKVQAQSTASPTSIAQAAAVAALNGDQTPLLERSRNYKERHDYVVGRLQQIRGIEIIPSDGTYYSLPDFSEVLQRLGPINTDVKLAEHLLEQTGVAMLPGSAFGAPGCLRLSFATSMPILSEAFDRLETQLGK